MRIGEPFSGPGKQTEVAICLRERLDQRGVELDLRWEGRRKECEVPIWVFSDETRLVLEEIRPVYEIPPFRISTLRILRGLEVS